MLSKLTYVKRREPILHLLIASLKFPGKVWEMVGMRFFFFLLENKKQKKNQHGLAANRELKLKACCEA